MTSEFTSYANVILDYSDVWLSTTTYYTGYDEGHELCSANIIYAPTCAIHTMSF